MFVIQHDKLLILEKMIKNLFQTIIVKKNYKVNAFEILPFPMHFLKVNKKKTYSFYCT